MRDFGLLMLQCTFMGQKSFHAMLFSYMFHIKPLIVFFKSPEVIFSYTFFLNISPLKAELIRVYANIFLTIFQTFIYKHLWF